MDEVCLQFVSFWMALYYVSMQNQNPAFGKVISRCIFALCLLLVLGLQAQAQSLDEQCEQFVDIGLAAEDLVFELDDLPTLVENFAEVDSWEDEGQATRDQNRKDELQILRTVWYACKDSLDAIATDWKRLQHLAVKGSKMGRQYSKGSKYIANASTQMAEGSKIIGQKIDEWSKDERQKVLKKLQKDVDRIMKSMNAFEMLSASIDYVCQDCNDSPEDHI